MQVASQSMSSKYINNSKIKFKCIQMKYKTFMNAIKNAHDVMLNLIIIFESLHNGFSKKEHDKTYVTLISNCVMDRVITV